MNPRMDISRLSQSAVREQLEAERTMLVLRKQRDVQQAQAQALLQLVQQSTSPDGIGRLIDVRV